MKDIFKNTNNIILIKVPFYIFLNNEKICYTTLSLFRFFIPIINILQGNRIFYFRFISVFLNPNFHHPLYLFT